MRKLLFLLAICFSASAAAQDFKILSVNTETVNIGGKELSAGDVFNKTDNIFWSNDKQAIKALSLSDSRQYILVANDFKEQKSKSAKDYFVRTNRLSTRGSGSLSGVARRIGEKVYVMDTTPVFIDYAPYESEYFFLLSDGKRYGLKFIDGQLLFDSSLCEADTPLVADLYFHYADGDEECLIEGLCIAPVPLKLDGFGVNL